MAIDSILAQIDAEIARLTQVRAMLTNTGQASARKSAAKKSAAPAVTDTPARKKRVLSPEARKRIADAQRKRWAAQRSKAKAK